MSTPNQPCISAKDIFRQFSEISLARHGNSPRVSGVPDHDSKNWDRPLSELGYHQASTVRNKLANKGYDLVVSSPFVRARETTIVISRCTQVVTLPSLDFSNDDRDPLIIMFRKFMYSPLSRYFSHELGDHLKAWAYAALLDIIHETDRVGGNARVFVGGHAVCQPAIAWAIGSAICQDGNSSGKSLQEAMLNLDPGLGEAEVILITLLKDRVFHEIVKP